jgi:hypothetical protein
VARRGFPPELEESSKPVRAKLHAKLLEPQGQTKERGCEARRAKELELV